MAILGRERDADLLCNLGIDRRVPEQLLIAQQILSRLLGVSRLMEIRGQAQESVPWLAAMPTARKEQRGLAPLLAGQAGPAHISEDPIHPDRTFVESNEIVPPIDQETRRNRQRSVKIEMEIVHHLQAIHQLLGGPARGEWELHRGKDLAGIVPGSVPAQPVHRQGDHLHAGLAQFATSLRKFSEFHQARRTPTGPQVQEDGMRQVAANRGDLTGVGLVFQPGQRHGMRHQDLCRGRAIRGYEAGGLKLRHRT